jgi:diaminopimelate epimerase
MRFWKGQALGNDYVLLQTGDPPADVPGPSLFRALCDRHRGVGGDGVLVVSVAQRPFPLRIYNPDGEEAEKSGNGLRIFGAWLHTRALVGEERFQVALRNEVVGMGVERTEPGGVRSIRVDMGPASFRSGDVHYSDADADAEVMGHRVAVDGEDVQVHLVSLGNPHCVVFVDELDPASFRRLAPRLQALPAFERGVNVQFARVVGPDAVEAMVWERGAGETLASGSSACAVAAAGRRTGALHGSTIRVEMPGGGLDVDVADDWRVHLSGPAQIVYEGRVPSGVLQAWR